MLQNQPHKPHKTENSRRKESPTQQVVRLAKYRSNFPTSKHTILVAASSLPLSSLQWEVVRGKNAGKRERRQNLTYIEAPARQA